MNHNEQTKGIIGVISRIREQANLFIEQALRDVDIEGVLPAHGGILYFLFQQRDPVAIKTVVEKVGRVKSTVTGMIKNLEQYGYVEKFQSPEDGRVMLVQLTEEGRKLKPVFDDISERLLDKVYGGIPEEERVQLVQQLRVILSNCKK